MRLRDWRYAATSKYANTNIEKRAMNRYLVRTKKGEGKLDVSFDFPLLRG